MISVETKVSLKSLRHRIVKFNGWMFTISVDNMILIKILVPFPLSFVSFWHPGPHWVNQMCLFRLLLFA